MPGNHCSYYQCKNSKHGNRTVSYFAIPNDPERREIWVRRSRNPSLYDLTPKQLTWRRFCSLHFKRKYFFNDLRNRLTWDAVPLGDSSDEEDTATDDAETSKVGGRLTAGKEAENLLLTKCDVPGCKNQLDPKDPNSRYLDTTFHKFPFKRDKVIEWATRMRRLDLIDTDEKILRLRYRGNHYICSEHFEKRYFANPIKTALSEDAVPTLFNFPDQTPVSMDTSVNDEITAAVDSPQEEESTDTCDETMVYASESLPADICPEHVATKTVESRITRVVREDNVPGSPKLCRLCGHEVDRFNVIYIFGELSRSKDYLKKMNSVLPRQCMVKENDGLPMWVCVGCSQKLDQCFELVQEFVSADQKLRLMLGKNTQPSFEEVSVTGDEPVPLVSQITEENCVNYLDDTLFCEPKHFITQLDVINQPPANTSSEESHTCSQCTKTFTDKNKLLNHESTDHPITSLDLGLGLITMQDGQLSQITFLSPVLPTTSMTKPSSSVACPDTYIKVEPDSSDDSDSDEAIPVVQPEPNESNPPPLKKVKLADGQEVEIQESHMMAVTTTSDRKSFLCCVCNSQYDSVESLLTHRFKQHPQEEIERGKQPYDWLIRQPRHKVL